MNLSILRDLEQAGGMAAVAAVVLTVVWLATMVRTPPPEGEASERLAFYAGRPDLLRVHFLPAMFIAVAYVPIWLGLAASIAPSHGLLASLTLAFGLLYVPFALIGYSLQFTAVRGVLESISGDEDRWLPVWRVLSFSNAPESATGWLVVLGYAIWGIGAAFAAAALVDGSGGLEVATGIALAVTALLTWLGAIGVVGRNPRLKWAVLVSGVTSAVATGLIAALLLG